MSEHDPKFCVLCLSGLHWSPDDIAAAKKQKPKMIGKWPAPAGEATTALSEDE